MNIPFKRVKNNVRTGRAIHVFTIGSPLAMTPFTLKACFLIFTFTMVTIISAQVPHLDVEGHTKIRGNIDINHPEDTSSVFIGRNAGVNMEFNIPSMRNAFLGSCAGMANTTGFRNSFLGQEAGMANTTGNNNSFFGADAGWSNTTGNFNSFFGADAGWSNTTGEYNSYFGQDAGRSNTTGNYNSFFGQDAGKSNTTGFRNSFFGQEAGRSNTTGYRNSFFGQDAGRYNSTGLRNSFFGQDAGRSNSTGDYNSFFGEAAGQSNTTGFRNSFFGQDAGEANTTGNYNSFFGQDAGFYNTTGLSNSFFGQEAGRSNSTGSYNSFFGQDAGNSNTSGDHNSFYGVWAGESNTTGNENSFFGVNSGKENTSGLANSFFGSASGYNNATGFNNSFFGVSSGLDITSGYGNAFFGQRAGENSTNGHSNTFIGRLAGENNITGSRNTFIGAKADIEDSITSDSLDRAIAIGYEAKVACSDCAVIGNENTNLGIGTTTPGAMIQIEGAASTDRPHMILQENSPEGRTRMRFINENVDTNYWALGASARQNGLGVLANFSIFYKENNVATNLFTLIGDGNAVLAGMLAENSDRRLKKNIRSLNGILPLLLQLHAYKYDWIAPNRTSENQIGLMAQEVSETFPELVHEGENGYMSVSYSRFVPLLIEAIREQEEKITDQSQKTDNQELMIAELRDENQELKDRLSVLEQRFQKLLGEDK